MMHKTWPLALLLACSGGADDDGTTEGATAPYPDCVTVETDAGVQELVRTFDASGKLVEETLDGAPYATYTYDGGKLGTKVTPEETWDFTWGSAGIASIVVTSASGAELGEYVYFYDGETAQLTDIALRLPDGVTEQTLVLEWVDETTSSSPFGDTSFVETPLAPPLSDPLLDPPGLLMVDWTSSQGHPKVQRDVDGEGVPVEERDYDYAEVAVRRTWAYCGG